MLSTGRQLDFPLGNPVVVEEPLYPAAFQDGQAGQHLAHLTGVGDKHPYAARQLGVVLEGQEKLERRPCPMGLGGVIGFVLDQELLDEL